MGWPLRMARLKEQSEYHRQSPIGLMPNLELHTDYLVGLPAGVEMAWFLVIKNVTLILASAKARQAN